MIKRKAIGVLAFLFTVCGLTGFVAHAQDAEKLRAAVALEKPSERQWADARTDELNQRARGMGLIPFPLAQQYLNSLYGKLKAAAGVADWPGTVHLVATPGLQAYATASGNIYIGLQWLVDAQSDDEIVALLAHEFGHIYLHYHQVDGVVKSADDLLNITATVALLAGKVAGVNDLISGTLVYQTGRELGRSNWGQSQEYAADLFALKLARKLGYSYTDGIKTVLERIEAWEKALGVKNQKMKEQAAEAVRMNMEAAELARRKNQRGAEQENEFSRAMDGFFSKLQGALGKAQYQFDKEFDQVFSGLSKSHPPTLDRQDRLAVVVDKEVVFQEEGSAVMAGLSELKGSSQFRSLTAAYAEADFAFAHLGTKEGGEAAVRAMLMDDSRYMRHAYIALALYRSVISYTGPSKLKADFDPVHVLVDNLKDPEYRAWMVVTEAAYHFRKKGVISESDRIWNAFWGGQYKEAAETWPSVISYLIDIKNYQNAKQIAAECVTKYPYYAKACNQAAQTPEEKAAAQKQGEAWVQENFKRWGLTPK